MYRFDHDTQTDILPGYPESAICVQRFDDSLHSAIHITYRNWLRSSSMHEPRDPPLEVVLLFVFFLFAITGWVQTKKNGNSVVNSLFVEMKKTWGTTFKS